jgi:hypothetical protein
MTSSLAGFVTSTLFSLLIFGRDDTSFTPKKIGKNGGFMM